jgi:hypothetical protein
MEDDCVLQCIGPKNFSNYIRPFGHCMQKNCSCTLVDRPNKSFSNPILPMGSYCTEGKVLLLFQTCILEELS